MGVLHHVKQQLLVLVRAFAFAQEGHPRGIDDCQIVAHDRLKLDIALVEHRDALADQGLPHLSCIVISQYQLPPPTMLTSPASVRPRMIIYSGVPMRIRKARM